MAFDRIMSSSFLCLLVCLLAATSAQTVQKMVVRSDIRFRFATTEVTCVMTNDNDVAKELTFDVTLPKGAFISNFSMEIEGQEYPGHVKEKQKAREQYLHALRTGASGGLVEQSARHSNKFDVSVNIAAGRSVTFRLAYEELLRRRFGAYEHAVYINPTSAEILDFSVEVYIQERKDILNVRTPDMRKDIINNNVEEPENRLTEINYPTPTTAHVVYRPSISALKEKGEGWFVVQYDVNTTAAGELMMVDGFFVHFFTPSDDLVPLPLDIVFVLDISGSMEGSKIAQLKDAMGVILNDLNSKDRFNILMFDGVVQHWKQGLQAATRQNVDVAELYVRKISARGSTNIHDALMQGLSALALSREQSRVPMLFFLTDGEATSGITDSQQILADVTRRNEGVVNIYSLAFGGGADYQLMRKISAQNKGFARKIYEASDAAKQVSGLYSEISAIVIRNLTITYHPTSNNDDGISISNDDNVLMVANVTALSRPTVFRKSDFCVAGRLRPIEPLEPRAARPPVTGEDDDQNADNSLTSLLSTAALQLVVSGLGNQGEINLVLTETDLTHLTLNGDNPFWHAPRDLSKMAERAWAFLTIQQLLEEKLAAEEDADLVASLNRQILELSLKYHFVTPLTSMVVTRPEDDESKTKAASFLDDEEAQETRQRALPSYSASRHVAAISRPLALYPAAVAPASPQGLQHAYDDPDQHHMMGLPPPIYQTLSIGHSHRKRRPHADPTIARPAAPTHRPAAHTTTYRPATPMTTIPARNGIGKDNGRKGKGGRQKNCVKNHKVILSHVTGKVENATSSDVVCYELKGDRSETSYTLLEDKSSQLAVSLTLSRRKLISASMSLTGSPTPATIRVDESGLLYSPSLVQATGESLTFFQGHFNVTFKVVESRCRVTVVAVEVTMDGSAIGRPTLVKESHEFGGVLGSFFKESYGDEDGEDEAEESKQGKAKKGKKKTMRSRKMKRENKKKKQKKGGKRGAKSCTKAGVDADESFSLAGRKLSKFENYSA